MGVLNDPGPDAHPIDRLEAALAGDLAHWATVQINRSGARYHVRVQTLTGSTLTGSMVGYGSGPSLSDCVDDAVAGYLASTGQIG